jgi:hypothetical protein
MNGPRQTPTPFDLAAASDARFLGKRHRHPGFDKRPVEIGLAGLADREHPSEPVDPALLASDLLRPNKVEERLCRCRRAVPNLRG